MCVRVCMCMRVCSEHLITTGLETIMTVGLRVKLNEQKAQTFTIPHFSFLGTFLVFDSLIFLSSVRVWCVGSHSLCLQYQLQPVQTLQRVTMRRLNPMRKLSMVRTVFKVRCLIYRTAPGDEFIAYSSSKLPSALAVYYCKEYQYYL